MKALRFMFVLAVLLLLGSPAFATGEAEEPGAQSQKGISESPYNPLQPYDPPIRLTRGFRDDNRVYPSGDDEENNVWTRGWEEELGIIVENVWSVPSTEYNSKLNVVIASNDLPDLIYADYDIYYRLAAGGQLEDLTQAYENANDPLFKEWFEMDGGRAKNVLSYDGSLYGLGETLFPRSALTLAYRTDWAERLGIDEPQSFDDVVDMMYAFTEEDPNGDGSTTYGLALAGNIWSSPASMRGFFAAYDAYPRLWVEEDGELAWGGITDESREVLLVLQRLYADGVIDPEFGIKNPWVELQEDFVSGKIGLTFSYYWFTDYANDTVAVTNGEGTWELVKIPHADGGVADVDGDMPMRQTLSMRRGVGYPEAVIKLIDFQGSKLQIPERMEGQYNYMPADDGTPIRTMFYSFQGINIGFGEVGQAGRIAPAVRQRDPSGLFEGDMPIYDACMAYLNGDLEKYGIYGKYGPGSGSELILDIIDKGQFQPNMYTGPNTETMNRQFGNLRSKQDEVYSRIIMGAPIDEFDEWVEYWNEQGGATITEEVNAWYRERP